MRSVLIIVAAFLLASPLAYAADADTSKLSVEQVVLANAALGQLNCGNKVIKDGAKETLVCESYKWTPGLTWQIATNQRKAQDVVTQYSKVRTQAISELARKPDGSPTDEAAAKFAVQDREWLSAKTDIVLDHFKKSDLEPMNLPPSIISALLPIIDQ